ncbi:hypothetical protein PLICRDRAFT_144628 [Plicaturopsis crispa FD-325 SS-3]|nr:hypothetical protein PLICRDRAFT_144628 [Plicaturopsis crispa FD-325 SS-3]
MGSVSRESYQSLPHASISARLFERRHTVNCGTKAADSVVDAVRHEDLWFLDGSVILRAEDTLFKVHMSQLARHSSFFRDLFSLPQPLPESSGPTEVKSCETSEGCPIVYLHDAAEDVANLLTALYDGPSFGDNGEDDFRIVSGILRLSSKYLVDNLRAKALAHISIAWPDTLKGWDTREDVARVHDVSGCTPHRYPSPIDVINLAHEVNAPSLLPAAFYDLSRYTFSQILESHLPSSPTSASFPSSTPSPPPSMGALSPPDFAKVALGKEASHNAIITLIQAMGAHRPRPRSQIHACRSSLDGGTCVSAAACRKDFGELVELATQHYLCDRERGCSDPLYVAEELGQLKSAELGSECKACARDLESWASKEREKVWKLLPGWFRLEQM